MKKIDKKTKMIIGGLAILGLFFAYKKGVFGGKKTPAGNDTDKPIVAEVDPTAETITPTGDPQGIIVNMLPTNFANLTPANSSMTYA